MSDTPRTDAVMTIEGGLQVVHVSFARLLERELNQKKEAAPVEAWRDGLSDELQKVVAAIDTDYERKVFNISFIQRRLKYGYVRAIDCANQLAALGAIEFRSNSEIIPLWQRRVPVTPKEEQK